jgi:hypothetical protein
MKLPSKGPWIRAKSASYRSERREGPSVLRHNLQCQPVRGVNFREECHWSHACKSFKRTCVGSNGILECKFLSENAHRTYLRVHVVPVVSMQFHNSTFSVVHIEIGWNPCERKDTQDAWYRSLVQQRFNHSNIVNPIS